MKISEVIRELADEITRDGDRELPEDFWIHYKYGAFMGWIPNYFIEEFRNYMKGE